MSENLPDVISATSPVSADEIRELVTLPTEDLEALVREGLRAERSIYLGALALATIHERKLYGSSFGAYCKTALGVSRATGDRWVRLGKTIRDRNIGPSDPLPTVEELDAERVSRDTHFSPEGSLPPNPHPIAEETVPDSPPEDDPAPVTAANDPLLDTGNAEDGAYLGVVVPEVVAPEPPETTSDAARTKLGHIAGEFGVPLARWPAFAEAIRAWMAEFHDAATTADHERLTEILHLTAEVERLGKRVATAERPVPHPLDAILTPGKFGAAAKVQTDGRSFKPAEIVKRGEKLAAWARQYIAAADRAPARKVDATAPAKASPAPPEAMNGVCLHPKAKEQKMGPNGQYGVKCSLCGVRIR